MAFSSVNGKFKGAGGSWNNLILQFLQNLQVHLEAMEVTKCPEKGTY